MAQFAAQIIENPLDRVGRHVMVDAGQTIADLLTTCAPAQYRAVLFKDKVAAEVPPAMFRYTRPSPGALLVLAAIAEGPVIPLAIGAVAAAVGPSIGLGVATGLGLAAGSFASTAVVAGVTAAVSVGGALLSSAFIRPPSIPQPNLFAGAQPTPQANAAPIQRRAQVGGSPVFSITGSSNQYAPNAPLPNVFGRHKMYPPLSSRGYSVFSGDDVIFIGRFCLGYGFHALHDLRIGNTPIWQLEDYELEFHNVDQAKTLARIPQIASNVRAWRQNGAQVWLGANDVEQEQINAPLEATETVTRTTADDTIIVGVDLEFSPGLIAFDRENKRFSATVSFQVRITGPGATVDETIRVTANSTSVVRRGFQFRLSTAGQWTVQVTRLTPDRSEGLEIWNTDAWIDGRTYLDRSNLVSIKSFQRGRLPSHPGVAEIALRIKASEQINGTLDTLNVVTQRLVPVWNGSTWSAPVENRHPAWANCEVLRGPSIEAPVPDSAIDMERHLEWVAREPSRTFDIVFDQTVNVGEVLDTIAAAGRARRTKRDLKYSVALEDADQPIVGMLTPSNSSDLQGYKTFPKTVHAFEANVIAPDDDWQLRTITAYAPGFNASNATEIERIDLTGVLVTSGDVSNAHELLEYYLRVNVLRPEVWRLRVALEHFPWALGAKLLLGHDVPLIAIDSGRVKAVTGNNVMLEGKIMADAGTMCQIRLRQPNNTIITVQGEVQANGSADVAEVAGMTPGDLAIVDTVSNEALEVIVTEIIAIDEHNAEVEVVPAAPDVLSITGPVPDYSPSITLPGTVRAPLPLSIRRTFSGIEATLTDASGNQTARIGMQVDFVSMIGDLPASIDIQTRVEGEDAWSETQRVPFAEVVFAVVREQFKTYEARVRSVSTTGMKSAWSATYKTYVALDLQNPGPVEEFQVAVIGEQAILTWERVNAEIDYYQIRHTAYPQGGWERANVVLDKIVGTQVVLPARTGAYLIKGVAVGGQFSSEARAAIIESTTVVRNVVETYDFLPFAAQAPNFTVENNELVFTTTDPEGATDYYWIAGDHVDLGAIYTLNLAAAIDANAFASGFNVYDFPNWYTEPNVYGEINQGWTAFVEFRSRKGPWIDDNGPWDTDWTRVDFREVVGQTFQFRICVSTPSANDGIRIYEANLTLDVPDRRESDNNIPVPVEGYEVTFAQPFRTIKSIHIDIANTPSGTRYETSAVSQAGFTVQLFDSTDTPIAATIDWLVTGYGKELV